MKKFLKIIEVFKGLWSLLIGLRVTGIEFFKPKITIHYPRREVDNLSTYRGHCELVPREDNILLPKCIMCGICMDNCPSGCIKINYSNIIENDRDKISSLDNIKEGELALGLNIFLPNSIKKGKQIEFLSPVVKSFYLNYTLCSLCGLCVENCPVGSLKWSHEVYLAGYTRKNFEYDLLKSLRVKGRIKDKDINK